MTEHDQRRSFWATPNGILVSLLLILLALYLWTEHQAHVLAVAPLVLPLALCIGMHALMHGGHGHGRRERPDGDDQRIG